MISVNQNKNIYIVYVYKHMVILYDEEKLNILMNEGNNWRILSSYLVNISEKGKYILYK